MQNDLKTIMAGEIPEALLPNLGDIINQLKRRILRLNENIENVLEIDDEIIYKEELSKTKAVLIDVQNARQQYEDNDLAIINTHATLELEYFKNKKKIDEKMNSLQKIESEDVEKYNSSLHKYNLFVNVVESID